MTYQDAIDFIYENRKPREDYSDTLKRLKHPLAQHLHDIPGHVQQLASAIEQYNKVEVRSDQAFNYIVALLRAGPQDLLLDIYELVKDRLPTIRYAFTDKATNTVRVRLMEQK